MRSSSTYKRIVRSIDVIDTLTKTKNEENQNADSDRKEFEELEARELWREFLATEI